MSGASFGIAGLGHALGEPVDVATVVADYTADTERVRSWGFRTFHRAAEGVGLTDLAAAAAQRALDAAGLVAADLDLVVLAVADLTEYLYWDAAAALQGRLAARAAEALLLSQACGGGVAAFDVVAGKFATHPEHDTALVVGANRVCEPYWNRMEINTSVFSDGAAAAVLRRDHPRLRWLVTEVATDGRYADFMRMDDGGAARPFGPATRGPVAVRSPSARMDEFFGGDLRKMFAFTAAVRAGTRDVVLRALERIGEPPAALSRLIHLHDNRPAFAELAKDLELPVERTNAELGLDHGHLGPADQLFALERHLAAGELAAADLVALTSTASGTHWMCTLLRA